MSLFNYNDCSSFISILGKEKFNKLAIYENKDEIIPCIDKILDSPKIEVKSIEHIDIIYGKHTWSRLMYFLKNYSYNKISADKLFVEDLQFPFYTGSSNPRHIIMDSCIWDSIPKKAKFWLDISSDWESVNL